jgi:hypothetical protein
MGKCVHYKNGKFRLWSSYNDDFVTDWVLENEIIEQLREDAMEHFEFEVKLRLERAKKNGCSIIPQIIRHKSEEL